MKKPSDEELLKHGFKPYIKTEPSWIKPMDKPFKVKTKEGVMEGKAGDFLCIGVEGEMWPLDKSIFEKSYKPMKRNK
jgi:hypothetical protein